MRYRWPTVFRVTPRREPLAGEAKGSRSQETAGHTAAVALGQATFLVPSTSAERPKMLTAW